MAARSMPYQDTGALHGHHTVPAMVEPLGARPASRVVVHHPRVAGFVAVVLAAALLLPPVEARTRAARGPGIDAVVSFPMSDGWDGGVLRYSPASEVLVLKFRRGADDPVASLAPSLQPESRRAIARVEAVPNERGSMTVRVHVERRGYTAKLVRNRRGRSWDLQLALPPMHGLQLVSYASLVPEGEPREILIQAEASMAAGEPACRNLAALRRSVEPWAAWASLRMADCLRHEGELGGSVGLALDLAGNPDSSPAVAALASLRLEEWAMNLHTAVEPDISPDVIASLPRDVAAELGVRVARTLAFRGRADEAVAALDAVSRLGVPAELVAGLDDLRLLLMHDLTEQGDWYGAARLFVSWPPPTLGSPAREGTIRLATLAYARLGLIDRAFAAGGIILRTGGQVVDPELRGALYEALLAMGEGDRAVELLGRLVSPAAAAGEGVRSSGVLTGPNGRSIANRLLRLWAERGVGAARGAVDALEAIDADMLVGAIRLAVLVTAGDCAAIDSAAPGSVPADYRAWAAACWIGHGDDAAAAASALQDHVDPLAGASAELEVALLEHAAASGRFRERIRVLSEPRVKAAPAAEAPAPRSKKRTRRKGGRSR